MPGTEFTGKILLSDITGEEHEFIFRCYEREKFARLIGSILELRECLDSKCNLYIEEKVKE